MATKRRPTTYQYEPLITPSSWHGDERQFSIRLTQIIDDIYQKYGVLREENTQLKKRLSELEAGLNAKV